MQCGCENKKWYLGTPFGGSILLEWILAFGIWNDTGVWIDAETWKDN